MTAAIVYVFLKIQENNENQVEHLICTEMRKAFMLIIFFIPFYSS